MTPHEREVMQMALNYIQPSEYGHCLCGHGEYCSYCSPNPARSSVAKALRACLAEPEPKKKLWLWKNHIDGNPEYWAFDNPYPKNLTNDDPQTLGHPCGYAIFKFSRESSFVRTEEQIIEEIKAALTQHEQYDQTELELCKKCGWKAVWPDGCLVCEKQEAQHEHFSDCAVHSKPAYPAGECDCGGVPPLTEAWRDLIEEMNCDMAMGELPDHCEDAIPWLMKRAIPRKEWFGLTDDEVIKEFWNIYPEEDVLYTDVERAFYRAIENKLKEKNNAD